MDALTHCIEAYANRFAHPAVDLYALEGMRLIGRSLPRAVSNPEDLEAREAMARGSMYGGLCLGPVNTAAVHALSYPLGVEFHVAHGLGNAVLLPHVIGFNIPSSPDRYASVALALGAREGKTPTDTARNGVARILDIARDCGIPTRISDLGITRAAIPEMARGALQVTRLLRNNLREISHEEAVALYEAAF
jgi:alcohol dehydrogenase class IV